MFKAITTLFGKAVNPEPLVVTPGLLNRRHTLCNNLTKIYSSQISLLDEQRDCDLDLIHYYTGLSSQYQTRLDLIKDFMNSSACSKDPVPEETFREILTPQLEASISELEQINSQIHKKDLVSLDSNYNNDLNDFFAHFHSNRIASSYVINEYISPTPLIQSIKVIDIVHDSIETTSRVLGLNNYPVPKFIISKETSDLSLLTTCVQPQIVHIMFEMFKNASLPSLKKGKPITISISESKDDTYTDQEIQTSLHERKFSLSKYHQTDMKNDSITIEINDQGGGMPMDLVHKIWHFHYTTSNDIDRDPIHGFGMGLPLCRVFAEFNDGKLILENRESDGVTIKIKLPRTVII